MARAWHERRDLPWSKVWIGWWQSLSHAELSAASIGIGIYMQTVANQRGRAEDGSGWVLSAGGQPMSVAAIARGAHATPAEVEQAIQELVVAETLVVREDGAVGFPHLQRFQETPDAARKRAGRTPDEPDDVEEDVPQDIPAEVPRNVRGTSEERPPESPAQTLDDQTLDDQREEERPRGRAPEASRPADLGAIVAAWNQGLADAAEDLGGPPNVARGKPGAPPGDLRAAVKDHPDPEAWRWCAYALATSWEATKADDPFKGFGLGWLVASSKKRIRARMANGQAAREQGRAATRAAARPVADVWTEVVELVLGSPRTAPVPLPEGPALAALRAIGGSREIREANERKLGVLRGKFLDAFHQAQRPAAVGARR